MSILDKVDPVDLKKIKKASEILKEVDFLKDVYKLLQDVIYTIEKGRDKVLDFEVIKEYKAGIINVYLKPIYERQAKKIRIGVNKNGRLETNIRRTELN